MPAVEYYRTDAGAVPVEDWLAGLGDDEVVARVLQRIGRVAEGNLGKYKVLGDGVSELKMDFGPGYRLYFGRVGKAVVLLLCGGRKNTQKTDIKKAKGYLADYLERNP